MFNKIKEKWQKRIERNAFKSTLTYINKRGIKFLKEGNALENLPEKFKVTEEVIFKRSLIPLGDWSRIYPPIDENGKINWVNLLFGGKKNLVKLIIILIIIGLVLFQFAENFKLIESLTELANICTIGKI